MKLYKATSYFFISVLSMTPAFAQDDDDDDWDGEKPIHCFYDTRVINGHSVETLEKGTLDFRITHRFGNVGVQAASRTLFGLDQATDIRIGFEYAPTDKLLFGLGRSKGAPPYSEFWDGFGKYAILKQGADMPISLTVVSSVFATSMASSTDSTLLNSFPTWAHRFSFYNQIIIARNFYDRVTLQLAPGYLHRNYVKFTDENSNFALGGMIRYNFYKKMSLVAEYYYVFRTPSKPASDIYNNPFGIGFEIKTYAHTFQLSFMNSEGIGEGQFIPYTLGRWTKGQWRFGFTISREF